MKRTNVRAHSRSRKGKGNTSVRSHARKVLALRHSSDKAYWSGRSPKNVEARYVLENPGLVKGLPKNPKSISDYRKLLTLDPKV